MKQGFISALALFWLGSSCADAQTAPKPAIGDAIRANVVLQSVVPDDRLAHDVKIKLPMAFVLPLQTGGSASPPDAPPNGAVVK